MRIISGQFKGKKILEPKNPKTRPLKDLTKESIFNILIHSNKLNLNLATSNILDLFSGVGSFGIECLSRGVKKVTFIENYSAAIQILKKNLLNLSSINNYEIIEKNIYEDDFGNFTKKKFDIVFLDPPYKDKNLSSLFLKLENLNIFKNNSIVILHRHKNQKDFFPLSFQIIEEKKYGISKIIFIKHLK